MYAHNFAHGGLVAGLRYGQFALYQWKSLLKPEDGEVQQAVMGCNHVLCILHGRVQQLIIPPAGQNLARLQTLEKAGSGLVPISAEQEQL